MPPQPMCPNCGSFDVEWERMSGHARVWRVVVAHPPLLPAYETQSPYNVVVVELVDDPAIRLVGNVVTSADARLDSVDPHSIEIGDEVEVCFATPVDGIALPAGAESDPPAPRKLGTKRT